MEDVVKLSQALTQAGLPVILEARFPGPYVGQITTNRMVIGFRGYFGDETKKAIPEVAKMTWLESLALSANGLTDAEVAPLAALTRLKTLDIVAPYANISQLTRGSFAILPGLKELRSFKITMKDTDDATDEDLSIFAGLSNLESLSIIVNSKKTSDAGLARLKTLTRLRYLAIYAPLNEKLEGGPAGTIAFDAIAGMKELEELRLFFIAPPEAYAKLAILGKLRKLAFRPGEFDIQLLPLQDYLRHVGKIKSLEELDVPTNKWTDEGVAHIGGLSNLKSLDLSGSYVTDAGLSHIKGLSKLQNLLMGGSEVTDAGLECLAALKELRLLACGSNHITGTGLKHLAGASKLEVLHLRNRKINDAGLGAIPALPRLERIDLTEAGITDDGLKHLAKLPNLSVLTLDETKVTDTCVHTLKQMPKLRIISGRRTKLTPAAAEELKKAGKTLEL